MDDRLRDWGCLVTPADIIAGIRELEAEIARLRAQVAALTAAPATTTTTTDGALLPCPFCGRTDTLEMAGARSHYVLCNCGGTCVAGPSGDTESEAITRWNTRALLTASTPSPAPADNSGADPARGEGVSARACWDCAHDSRGDGLGMCLRQCGPTYTIEVSEWIEHNYDRKPLPTARNCPGWAPKSGEVSDG